MSALGSTRTVRVDTRLLAATSRDLAQMVEDREFRSDLYYRLNIFPILVPPLRERPEDIPLSWPTSPTSTRAGWISESVGSRQKPWTP